MSVLEFRGYHGKGGITCNKLFLAPDFISINGMAFVILLRGGGGVFFSFWEGEGVCVAVTSHVKDGYEAETNWVVSCLAKNLDTP